MQTYHKIETLFKRDSHTKKLIEGEFINPTVRLLASCSWIFTEKVDGTNTRVHWDGHQVEFGGRTDAARMTPAMFEVLNELFAGEDNAQILEQKFGDKDVMIFGELYGKGIQKVGAEYDDHIKFILFDVMINGVYLQREALEDIAEYLGIDIVPVIGHGTLRAGVAYVTAHPKSIVAKNGAMMEGLVAVPDSGVLDRLGNRVIVKIKYRDFN